MEPLSELGSKKVRVGSLLEIPKDFSGSLELRVHRFLKMFNKFDSFPGLIKLENYKTRKS